MVAARGIAPPRLTDFKSGGSAILRKPRREMVPVKGIAPPRLLDFESSGSSLLRKPHWH